MKSRIGTFLQRNENLIHQSRIRSSRQRVLLRFAHLGGSHHLHRFGDLRRVADRSYPAPYILCIRHLLESSFRPVTAPTLAHVKSDLAVSAAHGGIKRLQTNHRQVVLNSSSAAFNCDSRSLSSSFFSRIAPTNPV